MSRNYIEALTHNIEFSVLLLSSLYLILYNYVHIYYNCAQHDVYPRFFILK